VAALTVVVAPDKWAYELSKPLDGAKTAGINRVTVATAHRAS
jgi:hypothetical protein